MTKKITFSLLICVLFLNFSAIGQEEKKKEENPWNVGGDASVTFLASAFSDAWSARDGGENSVTIGTFANFFAKYKKDNITWDNNLLAQYTTQRTAVNPNFVKTLDKLELLSFAGYKANKDWYYSMAFSMKTQWTPTYLQSQITGERDSVITTFMAPGEILLGPGFKYNYGDKKSKTQTSINISPATAKFIVIGSQQVADATYGGDNAQFEFGASVLGTYRTKLTEKLTYATNIELFSNYLENPQFVDVKWANILSTNIMKIITINMSFDLRYDNNTGPNVRTASTFGVGLGYKFN